MNRLFQSEPVLMIAGSVGVLLPAVFQVLSAFGVVLTPEQSQALTSLVVIVAGIYTRSRVSPVRPT